MSPPSFDSELLARTVDLRRRTLGRSWAQVAAETGVAAATIRRGGNTEVDGVVWLLQWLGMPFEAFVRTDDSPPPESTPADFAPDDGQPGGEPRWYGYCRFDSAALYRALDAARTDRGLTWAEVATEIGSPMVTTATLRAFQKGGRTSLVRIVPVLVWLGASAATFTTLPATSRGNKSTIRDQQSTIGG